MKEIDEQTGTVTRNEPEREAGDVRSGRSTSHVVQPLGYRQSSPIIGLVNILIGIAVGDSRCAWFLIAPSVSQSTNTEANKKDRGVQQYDGLPAGSDQIRCRSRWMNRTARFTAPSSRSGRAERIRDEYENLLKAYMSYQKGSYTSSRADTGKRQLRSALVGLKGDLRRDLQRRGEIMFKQLKNSGMEAFDRENYQEAITDARERQWRSTARITRRSTISRSRTGRTAIRTRPIETFEEDCRALPGYATRHERAGLYRPAVRKHVPGGTASGTTGTTGTRNNGLPETDDRTHDHRRMNDGYDRRRRNGYRSEKALQEAIR
jgi:hypothetical protein